MAIQIIAPADRTAQILADLVRRRADILDVTTRGENKVNETKRISFRLKINFIVRFFFASDNQCKCSIGRTEWIFE